MCLPRPLGFASACFVAGLAAVLVLPPAALAQADYAREKRWADEIVPAILIGDALELQSASGRRFLGIYAKAKAGAPAVIVVHGLGVHPDWSLINVLRTELAERGYATLSIQMPVLASGAGAERYVPLLPEASERIGAAVRFVRDRGHSKTAVVSHSLGSRMTNYHLEHAPDAGLDAWVSIGLADPYTGDSRLALPVLDVYGEYDLPAVRDNAAVRADRLRRVRGSAQIEVPGADHFFRGYERAVVRHIKRFLDHTLKQVAPAEG